MQTFNKLVGIGQVLEDMFIIICLSAPEAEKTKACFQSFGIESFESYRIGQHYH